MGGAAPVSGAPRGTGEPTRKRGSEGAGRGEAGLSGPLPLVGRGDQLASLEALIEDGDRDVSVVILSGEGGVGKSRLAAELASRAEARGWTSLTGRAYPVETGVPYALFADAFVPILRAMEPERLSVLSRGGEAELRNLFPALSIGGEEIASAFSATEPEEFRTRLMWNFAEFVKSYAARTPLLIVLEDLQWADASSLELLHFLARQSAGSPLAMLCTVNEAERDRSPQLVRTERSLLSLGVCESRRLEPLTREQVTELVARTFGVDAAVVREFAALLYGWTRGNPFFLEEIVKALLASGRLVSQKGTWVGWDTGDFELPGTIRDAVLTRFAGFTEEARTVAELAAIVGARASYPLLASISKLDESRLLSALEELSTHRVLHERADGDEVVYDFAHPLVRQTLYEELGLQRTRMLHGRVAEAMEVFYGDEAMEHADELAFHFARTDGGGQRAKAARYLAEAGRRALARGADREAVDYLRAALERASKEGTPEAVEDRARLMCDLASAHLHVGDFEDAVGPVAERAGDPGLLARVHRSLALLYVWTGPPEEAREHAQRAIDLADEVGDHSVEFWARWGLAVLDGFTGDTARMAEGIEEANALADRVRSPVLGLWTADMTIELEFGRGEWDRGIALGERLVALARNLNQRTLLPRLLVWTSLFYSGRGQLERARALVDEAVKVSGLDQDDEHVDVHVVVPAYIGLAHYFLALGDYAEAIDAGRRGLAVAEGAGYTLWVVHRLLPVLAEAYFWADRLDEAEAVAVRLRRLAEGMDHKLGIAWADAADALVRWKRGDPEGSIPLMRSAAEALEAVPMIPYAARLRRQLAARLTEIGDHDAARQELKRVHEVLAKLGAGVELEKARVQFRDIGTRPPPKGIGKGKAGLTGRELEVARAAARGLSNKAVARELGMAARTASTHLSNIYKKLDLSSRNELAEWMRTEGLTER